MGNKYYFYILVYVNDILVVDKDPRKFMTMLQDSYTVRKNTIKELDQYLGADIGKVHFIDGIHAWTMGSKSQVKNTVKILKPDLMMMTTSAQNYLALSILQRALFR